MKKLRTLLTAESTADKPRARMGTAHERVIHVGDEELPSVSQPCGPDCWLKRFLAYPRGDSVSSSHSDTDAGASEQHRRHDAQQLYSPIWSWQTRLIKILPGLESQLSCELLIVDLIATAGVGVAATGETVQYQALSYSWGYPSFTKTVMCNGISVPVIASLADALSHLRIPDRPRYLWIDAICINQFDPKEKSLQVRNMLLIYHKCQSVIAWLGMPDGNDSAALDFLTRIATSDTPVRNDGPHYHDETCAARYAIVCSDLNALLGKQWFARTWIRQEVYSSAELTLQCGKGTYKTNTLFRGIDVWQQCQPLSGRPSRLRVQHLHNQDTVEVMRQSRIGIIRWLKEGTKLPLPVRRVVDTGAWLEGLLAEARFGTTDGRDKVYGIVGMLEERSKALDQYAPHAEEPRRDSFVDDINYEKSVSAVYQDITRFLINRDRNLLPLCVFQDRARKCEAFPTWALSFEPGVRSWYIASQLTASVYPESTIDLQERFARGDYGETVGAGRDADGALRVVGYLMGNIVRVTREYSDRRVLWDECLSTSPPLPNKAGFHHYLRRDFDILPECNYQVVTIEKMRFGAEVMAHRPRLMLVSRAAQAGDMLLVAQGSPLPLVLRPMYPWTVCGDNNRQYLFLGPACFSVMSRDGWTLQGGDWKPEREPGYAMTANLMEKARQLSIQSEEFWLV